jgi:hypothetical protein
LGNTPSSRGLPNDARLVHPSPWLAVYRAAAEAPSRQPCRPNEALEAIAMMDTVLFTDHDIVVIAIVSSSIALVLAVLAVFRRQLSNASGDSNLKLAKQCGLTSTNSKRTTIGEGFPYIWSLARKSRDRSSLLNNNSWRKTRVAAKCSSRQRSMSKTSTN